MQIRKEQCKRKQVRITAVLIALVLLLLAGIWREVSLNQDQQELLAMLETNAGNYNEDRVVLSSTSRREARDMANEFGGTLRITDDGTFAVIRLPEGTILRDIAQNDAWRKYHSRISLDYNNFSMGTEETDVAADGDIRANFQSDEPMYPQQTYLDYINIGDSWNVSMGAKSDGEKVVVAVIDSGIDTDHPEFKDADGNSIISTRSYDATDDKIVSSTGLSVIEDEQGHGTAVAGVIASQINGSGIMGIAPDVELLVIKCDVDENGEFKSSADIVFGIYYAIEQDADVINMSLGSGMITLDLDKAIRLAVDSDIITVAAAGNDSSAADHFPAALDTTIGVGALEQGTWELAHYSNFGNNSDIMVPGTTLTAAMGGGYAVREGTSMAAPIVSAAIAIYRSQHPYATFEQVKNDLLAAGRDLGEAGEDLYFGFGALDMNAFICEEKGTITYDYCTEELDGTTQVFVKQHTIQTVPEPEREHIVFDDWYYDKGYTRVFDYDAWYTTEFVEDVTLYAKWVNEDDEDASVYSYKTLSDGTIEITSYKGKRRYLTVPDEIDGLTVSSIGSSAFAGNTRLREVILPQGLTMIREYAFDGVSRLRAVTFTGTQLQTIGWGAFQNCSALRKLELPDSVVSIGKEAFVNCAALNSVSITHSSALTTVGAKAFSKTALSYLYLPAGVTEFDGSVLAHSRNMRSIEIHPDNTAFTVQDGAVLSADGAVLVYYPAALTGTLTLPEGVVTVGDYACTASAITQVVLPESLQRIGTLSFSGTKLSAVHIPANVLRIGPGAFSSCSAMTDLTFAADARLTTIDGDPLSGGAFENCTLLSAPALPASLVTLGERCFMGCSSLTRISIPENVSSMGKSAFRSCRQLKTVTFAANCALRTIPKECFAYCSVLDTVTFSDGIQTLEEGAFQSDYLLRTLNFGAGSSLTAVGDNCFYSCAALSGMQLPETVSSIGKYAYAFSGLTEVHVPAALTSIGDGAFGACYLLTRITADADHAVYAAVDNVLFSKDITTVYCVPASRVGSYTLPDTVRITAPYSFYYDKFLTAVTLPAGLEEIQHDSFHSCSSLVYIDIPGSVTSIGRMGFSYCHSLGSVTFAEDSRLQRLGLYTFVGCGMTEITIPASVETMAQYVFSNCSNLKKITFASGSRLSYVAAYLLTGTRIEEVIFRDGSALTHLQAHAFDGAKYLKAIDFGDAALDTIDNYAFYNCAALESITIPETVTFLGRYAFYGCTGLERMDLPVAVDYIGVSAFNGTGSMKVFFAADTLPANAQVGWDEGIAGYFLGAKEYIVTQEWEYLLTCDDTAALVRYTGSAGTLTLDTVDGYPVEKIGAGCFADNRTLTSVTLGANIREIDHNAFRNAAAVVTIPADSVLERIGNCAFSGNATESLNLPDSVTHIGTGAFEESSLKTLTIGADSALETIGDQAFHASGIETICLPATLKSVGVEAFADTAALTEVTIAESDVALKLSNSAFEGSGITQITIPARVNYIGEYAFGSCPALENIHVDDTNTAYQDLDGVLLDSSGTTLIQYPCGRYGSYEVPARITVLTYTSFKNAKGLTEVTFAAGSTVRTIGWQTFSGCESLTKITVPDTVISFDFYAFENCTSLTDVVLGDGNQLTGVYEGAFYGCTALTQLSLPDTVIDIGDYAFYGCTALAEFPLTENAVTKGIGAHAFDGCTAITRIPALAHLADVGEYAFAHTAISEFTVPAVLKEIAGSAFYGCESLMNIYCDEASEEYTAIDGALYEKGADSADDYDALVVWPYGKIMKIGTGKTEITAEDTVFLKENADIRWAIADTVTTIGERAFYDHKFLKRVTIPEGITTIGKYAFYNCYSLQEVYFNATAANDCSAYVFYRAGTGSNGSKVVIGANVTRIPAHAFDGYTGLTSITIPESVTSIGYYAFYGCTGLTSAGPIGGGYNYEFGWTNSIPDNAFAYCSSLSTVMLPESITVIGNCAFDRCAGLQTITLPESVTAIGKSAFNTCKSLTNIVIPEGVTSIEDSTFMHCISLTSVTIPESVETMGPYAFYDCKNLETIHFNAKAMEDLKTNHTVFSSAGDNSNGITVIFGANVTKIPAYLFYTSESTGFTMNLVKVIFEEGSQCTHIGGYAFYGRTGLVHITVPESVTAVGDNAFGGCTGLTSAGPIGGGYCYEFGWTESIPAYAFRNLTNLSSVLIPGSVTSVGDNAFANCNALTSAGPIGGGYNYEFGWIDSIPSKAFQYCYGLTDVTIPASVTTIGNYAFYGCTDLKNVVMPDCLTTIGNSAFYACRALTSITIPENVTTINKSAFSNCEALGEIRFNAANMADLSTYNYIFDSAGASGSGITVTIGKHVTRIPAYLFDPQRSADYAPKINRVVFEDGSTCTSIGSYTFNECTDLTSLSIPESVTTIGSSAFSGCTGLTSAGPIGGGYNYEFGWTESIPAYAFNNCTSLSAVTFPGGITTIGDAAFSGCSSLTEITIPESVSMIDTRAFSHCSALEQINFNAIAMADLTSQSAIFAGAGKSSEGIKVIIGANVTNIPAYLFYPNFAYGSAPNIVKVLFEEGSVCKSIGAEAFSNCTALSSIAIAESVTSIGDHAFDKCTSLSSVVVPEGVTNMGSGVFYGCTKLTSAGPIGGDYCIEFGWTEAIPNNAFHYCTGLTTIVIPESITHIGDNSFYECQNLTSITIPDHVTKIGSRAFNNCKSLIGIKIPHGATEIAMYAFNNCSSLTSITIPENITKISTNAFYNCANLTCVQIESPTIAKGITSATSCGYLCSYANTVLIPADVTTIGSYITDNFTYVANHSRDSVAYTAYSNHAHDWDERVIILELVKCQTDGVTAYTCATCGLVKQEAVSCHELTHYEGQSAACDTPGWDAYDACADCGYSTYKEISATGHSYESTVTQPTCTEQGFTTHTCAVCGDSYTDSPVEAAGHSYESVVTEPTCTEQGFTTHICAVCGDSYVDSYTDALGHDYQDGTCTTCGAEDPDFVEVAAGCSGDLTWILYHSGRMVFSGEGAMKNYTTKDGMPWYDYADQITNVVIEDGVTSIGDYAFYGMPIESITIADSVTTIGAYAFKGCEQLDGVVLPGGLTKLGESAFYGCTALTAIEIPASLWTVQPYTFKNCTALAEVTFHEGNLQKISDGAFYNTALTELVLPDCLDILDVYSFKNCAELASITIGSGITEIREAVFYSTAIPTITIPEGITKIGPYAFKNCVNLVSVDLPESLTSVGEASFYACTGLKTVELPDAVTTIGNYAFRKCAAIETLTFGSELTTIGESSFYGCTGLTELVIPDKVTTIKPYAFKTCTGLTSVTLGSSVQTIGEGAFNTCTGLKTIVFPASVTSIGDYCFSGSWNLWQLTFQGDAPSIGTGAFKGMNATAYYPGDNTTWTSDIMQNYGGTVTWKAN